MDKIMEQVMDHIQKKWKSAVAAALVCCAALGWWGTLYPQFTMVQGTYSVVDESGRKLPAEESDGGKVYWNIMKTDRIHIRFKSKLLEDINTLQGQRRDSYGLRKQ